MKNEKSEVDFTHFALKAFTASIFESRYRMPDFYITYGKFRRFSRIAKVLLGLVLLVLEVLKRILDL